MDEEIPGGADAVSQEHEVLLARVAELEAQAGEATARAETLAARWRETVARSALALALQQAGCRDVGAALVLAGQGGIAVDEDGAAQGVEEAVAALKTERAYLFIPRGLAGGANPGPASPPADPAATFAAWLREC